VCSQQEAGSQQPEKKGPQLRLAQRLSTHVIRQFASSSCTIGLLRNSDMKNVRPEIWQLFALLDIARWSVKRNHFNFRRDTEESHLLYPLGNDPSSKSRTKFRRANHLSQKKTHSKRATIGRPTRQDTESRPIYLSTTTKWIL